MSGSSGKFVHRFVDAEKADHRIKNAQRQHPNHVCRHDKSRHHQSPPVAANGADNPFGSIFRFEDRQNPRKARFYAREHTCIDVKRANNGRPYRRFQPFQFQPQRFVKSNRGKFAAAIVHHFGCADNPPGGCNGHDMPAFPAHHFRQKCPARPKKRQSVHLKGALNFFIGNFGE